MQRAYRFDNGDDREEREEIRAAFNTITTDHLWEEERKAARQRAASIRKAAETVRRYQERNPNA